ncbi:unnamed protein product [Prorocentrum cordatum]|uniref:RNase H type-1 domain-containing protein n=1 Tax=Prorocentrum cordatum TaxID=2364126 RepID=A0ABN9WH94_9DINO|nr:unnamed protein product [Polarella glacialis]
MRHHMASGALTAGIAEESSSDAVAQTRGASGGTGVVLPARRGAREPGEGAVPVVRWSLLQASRGAKRTTLCSSARSAVVGPRWPVAHRAIAGPAALRARALPAEPRGREAEGTAPGTVRPRRGLFSERAPAPDPLGLASPLLAWVATFAAAEVLASSPLTGRVFLDGSATSGSRDDLAGAGQSALTTDRCNDIASCISGVDPWTVPQDSGSGELLAATEALRHSLGPVVLRTDSHMVFDGWHAGRRRLEFWELEDDIGAHNVQGPVRIGSAIWHADALTKLAVARHPRAAVFLFETAEKIAKRARVVARWIGTACQLVSSLLQAPDGYGAPEEVLAAITCTVHNCHNLAADDCQVAGPSCRGRVCEVQVTAFEVDDGVV